MVGWASFYTIFFSGLFFWIPQGGRKPGSVYLYGCHRIIRLVTGICWRRRKTLGHPPLRLSFYGV